MNTIEFFNAVLPSQGNGVYCITTISGEKRYCQNRPFLDIATATNYALSMATRADVYFAMSTFAVEDFKRKADRSIKQKSMWLDLDVDPEKAQQGLGYATQRDALLALQKFLQVTGLPEPIIVNSGYGWHLYWPFTQEVDSANWKIMAGMLAKICKTYNLIADHHRTKDLASVLRVPGTLNHKRGTTANVAVATRGGQPSTPIEFAKKLIALSGSVVPTATPMPVMNGVMPTFSTCFTEYKKDQTPRSWISMAERCHQIGDMASSSYPAWMLAVRTLLHTDISDEWLHKLAALDKSKYNKEALDRLIVNLRESKDDYGPGLCETFESLCPQKCANCPYKNKIKTPWKLADVATQKEITVPAVSLQNADLSKEIALGDATETITIKPYKDSRFAVVPGKGIYKIETDEDGVPMNILISDIEIYIHTLCIDNTVGLVPKRTYLMRKVAPGCAPVDIPFSISDALGAEKMVIWTAQCGMLPNPQYAKDFYKFMNTYIAAVQNNLPEVYVRNHFGWEKWTDKKTGKTENGFIVGPVMYTSQGTQQVRLDERSQSVANKMGGTCGTLEEWKKVPKLYSTLDQKFAQLLMCASFGAPLMQFGKGTATNVAYNLWDINGGKGKSALLKALASVWGDPQQMPMGRTDTHAARFQQYSVYRNLPILIDEITGIHDDDAASMLYDIVNGREKARSTSSGTGLAQSGHWETITVFTANQSLYESLRDYRSQTSATCMRLIECVCDFKDYTNTPLALEINDAMTAARNNYGIAGKTFIQYIMKHPVLIDAVIKESEKFAVEHARSSDERFWLYGMAIPLCAGMIAKAIGLIDYDIDALRKYCVEELLPSLRAKVKVDKPTGSNLLVDFLNDNLDSTLIVKAHTKKAFERDNQGMPVVQPTFNSFDPYVVSLPSRMLYVRRELDSDTVYVSSRALADWCKRRGVSMETMLTELTALGYATYGLKTKRFALGYDVPSLVQATQMVYKFHVAKEIKDEN